MRVFAILAMTAGLSGAAQIDYDAARHRWTLKSGSVEYRLEQRNGMVRVAYFGPAGRPDWQAARFDMAGVVHGQNLLPADLELVSHRISPGGGRTELRLVYRHRRLPLEIEAVYAAWGSTGVFTRRLTFKNNGDHALEMQSTPSLSWRLPGGAYSLDYLYGRWGGERRSASEKIGPGRRSFVNTSGRSTNGYSPWFSLRNDALGVRYAAQLAYSGNWEMLFERQTEGRAAHWIDYDLHAELGMRFDFGGAAPLAPGASFRLPAVAFTSSAGDLDDIANQLHRYQYRYVIARTPINDPLLTQFNSWYPVLRSPKAAELKKYADEAAALGLEAFIIDAGWFSNRGSRVDPIYGDWDPDPVAFPKGLRDVADYVHAKGMRFGVWVEMECGGTESRVVREHPDWVLRYNGKPKAGGRGRVYLDFARPEVRRWARAVIDRLVREDKVDWLKLDYNVDVGQNFDPPGPGRSGTVLYNHLRNYLEFLDGIRKDYPGLVLENCSSGGLRFDLAIIARTHTTWLSDVVDPRRSVQLAYGCTVEFTPGICNHWMVGDKENGAVDLNNPAGWWDFMFRIAMNGQFGVSSRIFDWSPALKKRAAGNIALYKRLRGVIAGGDVYHLTAPPAAGSEPTGWMALQYNAEDRKRGAVLAFRLGKSEARKVLRLRGLEPNRRYRATEEGRLRGVFSGEQLAHQGLTVELPSEWRSSVIEFTAEP
ncbi:MAG: alpha-galactosidase [Acidobacteria bacterium]|nr:alpha-galactosidase [Acidobacteriota bacterium]